MSAAHFLDTTLPRILSKTVNLVYIQEFSSDIKGVGEIARISREKRTVFPNPMCRNNKNCLAV